MKFQLIIDRQTEMIISTELFNGKAHDHDLTILKQTTRVDPAILVIGDSGYRGLQKLHPNSLLPIRHKADIDKLTDEQKATRKQSNKSIASIRMKIEHIVGCIKRFKIVAEKYRNRLKRLLLRFNLICGVVNYERNV
ncbi:MAG: transposase [Defluviitaleaceae bacterium]|nr:transposase [Defluviitaleaceae bacterium]